MLRGGNYKGKDGAEYDAVKLAQLQAALGESSSGGGGIAGIGGGGLSCTNDVLWINDSPVEDLGVVVYKNYSIHLYNIHIR